MGDGGGGDCRDFGGSDGGGRLEATLLKLTLGTLPYLPYSNRLMAKSPCSPVTPALRVPPSPSQEQP